MAQSSQADACAGSENLVCSAPLLQPCRRRAGHGALRSRPIHRRPRRLCSPLAPEPSLGPRQWGANQPFVSRVRSRPGPHGLQRSAPARAAPAASARVRGLAPVPHPRRPNANRRASAQGCTPRSCRSSVLRVTAGHRTLAVILLGSGDADHNRDGSRPTYDAEVLAKNTATAFQGSSGKNSGPLGCSHTGPGYPRPRFLQSYTGRPDCSRQRLYSRPSR